MFGAPTVRTTWMSGGGRWHSRDVQPQRGPLPLIGPPLLHLRRAELRLHLGTCRRAGCHLMPSVELAPVRLAELAEPRRVEDRGSTRCVQPPLAWLAPAEDIGVRHAGATKHRWGPRLLGLPPGKGPAAALAGGSTARRPNATFSYTAGNALLCTLARRVHATCRKLPRAGPLDQHVCSRSCPDILDHVFDGHGSVVGARACTRGP
mmetsp:Transcript_78537/g.168292  ORF Transcript_78537/g.168292 Transcript_78537/m.168292 type:complete len:206 (-) Transcript_78537:567-1184(-)